MAAFALVFTSCEDPITPDPEPEDLVEKYFDIWVKAGTDQPSYLVKNVADVSDPSVVIDYLNAGADITGKLMKRLSLEMDIIMRSPSLRIALVNIIFMMEN